MIKKLILSLLLMVTAVNAYESDLIRPKAGQPTIIDIGITDPTAHSTIIPKDWILIDAQFREIDKESASVARDLSPEWDCMSDDLKNTNCSEQDSTCPGNVLYNQGNSTKVTSKKEEAPFKQSVPRAESINPNNIKGDYQILPTGGEIDGSRFAIIKNGDINSVSSATLMNQGYKTASGKFAMRMFSFGSGCGGFSVSPTPSRVSTIVNGGSRVTLQGYRENCNQLISSGDAQYAVVLVEWDVTPTNVSFTCDDYCLIGQPDMYDLGFWNWVCPVNYEPLESTSGTTQFCNPTESEITRTWNWCDSCSLAELEAKFGEIVNAVGGSGLAKTTIDGTAVYKNTGTSDIFVELEGSSKLKIQPNETFYFKNSDKPSIVNRASGSETGRARDKPNVIISTLIVTENCTDSDVNYPTKCEKSYNYYRYDCDPIAYPDDYNYKGAYFWQGPLVTTGGDCDGNCGGYGCNCNSAIPPANNCGLKNFTCPFDTDKACTKVTTEEGEPILADPNYIYENGTSQEFSDRLVEERSCEEDLVWNADEKRCEDIALKVCLKADYTIDYALNECFGPASCETDEIYDENLLKCVQKISDEEKCGENFAFDNNANKCVKVPECVRGGIFNDGQCKTKIDTCLSGDYDAKGECLNLVGVHLFANILLEPNIGSMHGVEKEMTFHIAERIEPVTLSTSTLQSRGYTSNGTNLKMKVFHYGSGCGGIKFNPAPDSISILQSGGSILNNTDPSVGCSSENYMITSQSKEFMKVEVTWNNPPASLTYDCDDFCALDQPSYTIDSTLITLASEICPENTEDVFWRYSKEENKCIADMLVRPFLCEGDDWIYDEESNICAALMNTWHIAQDASPGIWYISPDQRKMYQAENAGIILNISDKIYTEDVTFKGDFIIMDGDSPLFADIDSWADIDTRTHSYKDDDFIGFVFGYDEFDKNGFLFSINKSLLEADQPGVGHSFDGYDSTTVSGASLRYGNPLNHGWGLGTMTDLKVLDSNLGSATELQSNNNIYRGWSREERSSIKIDYTESGIKIWINGALIIDHQLLPGEYKAGKIGFLNYSQGSVLYEGFQVLTSNLCEIPEMQCEESKSGIIWNKVGNDCVHTGIMSERVLCDGVPYYSSSETDLNSYYEDPIFLASKVSRNGSNGGWERIRYTTNQTINIKIDEDHLSDRQHIAEEITSLVISKPFSLSRIITSGTLRMEAGKINVNNSARIDFKENYGETPLVFLLGTSSEGDVPAVATVKGVSSSGFTISIESSNNVPYGQMNNVNYFVINKGDHYDEGSGLKIFARTVDTSKEIGVFNNGLTLEEKTDLVSFETMPSIPGILGEIQTNNNPSDWRTLHISNRTTDSFRVSLERTRMYSDTSTISNNETIGYLMFNIGMKVLLNDIKIESLDLNNENSYDDTYTEESDNCGDKTLSCPTEYIYDSSAKRCLLDINAIYPDQAITIDFLNDMYSYYLGEPSYDYVGYIFSEELNACYKPVLTIYSNTAERTFEDELSKLFYNSQALCPLDGVLSTEGYCEYDLICEEGTYNIDRLFCEKPMATDMCIAPKALTASSLYKDKELEKETINIKASGEFYDNFPTTRGKKTGLSLNRTLLKFSDNNWYKFVTSPSTEVTLRDNQISNSGLTIKSILELDYTLNNYANGECFTANGSTSNDCVSNIDIKLPTGLSIIAISDIDNVLNLNTGDNFYNDRFLINDKYGYNRKGFGSQSLIGLVGTEPICSQLPICPEGETLSYNDLEPICKSNEVSYYCKDGKTLIPDTSICANDGYCEEGFVNLEEDGTCIRDYTYYKYFCSTDFEIAEEGIDCQGSCGYDDCFCNTETPPANNCKKEFNTEDIVEQVSVRTIRTHNVKGSLLEEEYENYKNYNCGKFCKFNIVKITGESNKLCFEKKNGDAECFEVDGCSFKGTIEDLYSNEEVAKLKDLNLPNTHILTIADYNLPNDIQTEGIDCPSSGMSYSEGTRYCEGSASFYTWEKKGSADGDWDVTTNGTKIFQGFNTTSAAFYVSTLTYPQNVVFSGSMTTGNDGDDDWVGLVFGFTGINDYYVVRLTRDSNDPIIHNVTHHNADKLSLVKVTGGIESTLITAIHPGWRANVPLDIKVAYIDKEIKVFIGETEFISYDSSIDLVGGRIGFYNLSQSTVTYEGFHISSSPLCDAGYEWEDASRSCVSVADQEEFPNNKIESTCKMNGHIGWHSREEGIVSIISDGDRIKFWDPYKDKDLGFLEFVKDTNEQDNLDGFRPENQELYNLLSDGFTSIDSINSYLYYVSGEVMTLNQCDFFANKYDLFNTPITSSSDKLKQMSGDRYKRLEIEKECNQGVFAPDIQECLGGINNPELCVNGKFTENSNLSILGSYGIYSGVTGINVIQPLEIYNSGEYTFELETTETLSLELDGAIIANLNASTEPYARFTVSLEKGFHKLFVNARSLSTMALTISDASNTKFYHSRLWCDNRTSVTCPVSGFANYNNICERRTSSYCVNGEFNEDIKKCILEPKCILRSKDVSTSFSDQDQSVKVEYFEDATVRYMCSPLTCTDNFCQIATCPAPSVGTDVEITSSEREELGNGILCLDQECDANLDYYPLCGIEGSCDTTREDVVVKGKYPDEKCYEKYCEEGNYDPETGQCRVLECPNNSEEDASGNCIRK